MKAVLGLLFLMVGLTVGYLVITGKLPVSNPTPPTSSSTSSPAPVKRPAYTGPGRPTGGPAMGSGGPTGLPTMMHMHDVAASSGGMR